MAANKTKRRVPAAKTRSVSSNGKPAPCEDSIRLHLSKVPGVEAVYFWVDGRHVVHVTSIIKDHDSDLYDLLIPMEERVERESPELFFDFHVRARQNRTVEQTIPTAGILVFKRK